MMPGVSGHDALTAIRRLELEHGIGGTDGVKVIMTTALRDSKHCIQSFREGCECFLTKPIHDAELLEKMRELDVLPVEETGRHSVGSA
jgi:two-component system chemotaxis response regulator CheY